MNIIKFTYCSKEYYFKDVLIFTGTTDFNEKKRDKIYLKIIHDPNSYSCKDFRELNDKYLLDNLIIKDLPKPTTFPKFNNENQFIANHDGKRILNPTITAIRWTGYIWEYQLKNIGHECDYQPENSLKKLIRKKEK